MRWLSALGLVFLLSAGCGSGDVCQQASEHIAECTAGSAQPVSSCGATEAALAEELLAMDCYEIQLAQSTGKAEVASSSMGDLSQRPQKDNNIYDVCDPDESDVCEYCSGLTVSFNFLGIRMGSCLIKNTCSRVEEGEFAGHNLCSCTFMMGSCLDEAESPTGDEVG